MRMPSNEQRELERTRYWQGQMLRSGDFRGQVATDLQYRWWHNRALHNAYGVALGYEASRYPKQGDLLGVELAPGVAYDCFGRGLILLCRHTVLLPPNVSSPITLLARYCETWDYPDPRETNGVCLTCCENAMAQEHPQFVWTTADPPDPSAGVPLVRVGGTGGIGTLTIDQGFEAMMSAPLAGPYLANGSTVPGGTPWTRWTEGKRRLGIQTDVDTSAAGFQQTPCYFAWLQAADPTDLLGTVIFTHIAHARPDGFRFRILVASIPTGEFLPREMAVTFAPPPFYVCWLGCESQTGTTQCLKPEVRKPCCS